MTVITKIKGWFREKEDYGYGVVTGAFLEKSDYYVDSGQGIIFSKDKNPTILQHATIKEDGQNAIQRTSKTVEERI